MSGQDEREALVQVMRDRDDMFVTFEMHADAILAAGFRRPTPPGEATPVVETVEELDALPNGTIVKSSAGTVACRHSEFFGVVFGDERPFPWDLLALPATVLTPAPAPADREALVERVAHAIAETDYVPSDGGSAWEAAPDLHDSWRVMARAALDAIEGVRHA